MSFSCIHIHTNFTHKYQQGFSQRLQNFDLRLMSMVLFAASRWLPKVSKDKIIPAMSLNHSSFYRIGSTATWCMGEYKDDGDMRVDHSDITASTWKWPKKVGDLPNKARKLRCGPAGFLGLFILRVIVMWQCLRAFVPFQECLVHPVFIFCLFFRKWGQKRWSVQFWWVIINFLKLGGPQGNFRALFSRSPAFFGHFWVDAVTSEPSTHIPSSRHLFSIFLI